MHSLHSHNLYFSTTYHPSVYDITYKTLGHIYPGIDTESWEGEYIPYKKEMESERNFSVSLSSICPGKSLNTHQSFYPE